MHPLDRTGNTVQMRAGRGMTQGHPFRKYDGGYVTLPNETVNDRTLSFRARGVLAYLIGRPPGWRFNAERICQEGTEGRDAVAAALRELAERGYYRWTRFNAGGGRFVTVTEAAATPALMPPPPTREEVLAALTGPGSSGSGDATEPGLPDPGEPVPGEPGSKSVPRTTTESQTSPRPSDGSPATPKATGTRLEADWQPDVVALAWAADHGISDAEVKRWTEAFVDHWVAVPGQRGRKIEWTATWRNWLRREQDRQAGRSRVIENRHLDAPVDAEQAERRAAWGET